MESLDLHGMDAETAIQVFLQRYNQLAARQPGARLEVIHGYGSAGSGGAIKRRLRQLWREYAAYLHTEVAPGNNPGATVVCVKAALPDRSGTIESAILQYCVLPRTESKILGQFRRQGDPQVRAAIRALHGRGLLKRVQKGRHRCYQASGIP